MSLGYNCADLWATANGWWGGDFKGMLRAWGWNETDIQTYYDACRITDFPIGVLRINVRVPGSSLDIAARVYVDSVFVGVTPLTVTAAVGQHSVTIEDNIVWYNNRQYTHPQGGVAAIVDANITTDVILDLEELTPEIRTGTLVVKTAPVSGVPVFVDSVSVGVSPVTTEQAVGSHSVSAGELVDNDVTYRPIGEKQALVDLDKTTEVTIEMQASDNGTEPIGGTKSRWVIPALLAGVAIALTRHKK